MQSLQLARWREARRKSLGQLSRLSGLPEATVRALEAGSRPYDQAALEALSKALQCSPAELFSEPPSSEAVKVVAAWRHPHSSAGHFLREWRRHRGLTLEGLAALTGVSHGNISRLERGLIPYSQNSFEIIAAALGTDPAALILLSPDSADAFATLTSLPPARQRQLARIAEIMAEADAEGDVPKAGGRQPPHSKERKSPSSKRVVRADVVLSEASKVKFARLRDFRRT